MFHITFWKSPDPSVIISPLPPPSSPSSSLHLLIPPPPTFPPSSLPPFYPPPSPLYSTLHSHWVISSFRLLCRNHVWNLILSVRLHQTLGSQGPLGSPSGPDTPHLLSDSDVSHVGIISPLFSLSLPFSTSSCLFFTLLHSSCLSPAFTFLVSWTCLVSSSHR